MKILVAEDIQKSYPSGERTLRVLKGVSLSLEATQSLAIMGPSGSGKSTLLQILGAMLRPDSGRLTLGSQNLLTLNDGELSRLRRRELGFVFQKFNLLNTLSALDNVAWPLLLDGKSKADSEGRARELLAKVGLTARADHYPRQLSGGEQQRVAIARALVARPRVLLADEPTGSLDSETGQHILKLLKEATQVEGAALVMVTHDERAARICDHRLMLKDGAPC